MYWKTLQISNDIEYGFSLISSIIFNVLPHSSEIERLFSLEKLFRTKLRSCLGEERSIVNFMINFSIKSKYNQLLIDKGCTKNEDGVQSRKNESINIKEEESDIVDTINGL